MSENLQRYYLCTENTPQHWTCVEKYKEKDELMEVSHTTQWTTIIPVYRYQPYLFDRIVIAATLRPTFKIMRNS